MVHSQKGEPYDSFTLPFFNAFFTGAQKVRFEHVVLNNHEKYLDRYLAQKKPAHICAVVAVGTVALRAIRDQKIIPDHIPVIFGAVTDPIGEKVISSFEQPQKGRFTGVAFSVHIKDRLRYMRKVFPQAKKIGVIYTTMPQSISFKKWLMALKDDPEFHDLEFLYRRVGMRTQKNGPQKMVKDAKLPILSLKDKVDIFLSPSDQMGILPEFAQYVVQLTNKPVFGLAKKDVTAHRAAVASVYPDMEASGEIAATMLQGVLAGKPISDFTPKRPQSLKVFNERTARLFNLKKPD
ncbi:ABC transporter substrate binding protein [Terasakiella sp. SH-1]|uniref:ABC transporter substrate-binding protein n=1 Tax=Terasakiella sp. SH-1 TaxID=2560057 RepID=UPI001073A725|nr:ABC transporter substrate binding protein [Terasakiella sp. SH-1]